MTPAVVVDVGNSRIKWGLCSASGVRDTCSLSPDDPAAWEEQARRWQLAASAPWAVTGVHPARCEQLVHWLRRRGHPVRVVEDPSTLPLRVLVAEPRKVGMDRLFDAVAANSRRRAGVPAVVIDAGSAVTVDLLDETGAFVGGVIFPGLRLMAQALHDYTALLPLIPPPRQVPLVPGTATIPAMEAGIFWAAAGGVRALIEEYRKRTGTVPEVFLTGGDAAVLREGLGSAVDHYWLTMTLEGIRLTAEALP